MVRLATLKRAERYRFHTMLYKALTKIEQYFCERYRVITIPKLLAFEANIAYVLFQRIMKPVSDPQYRQDKLIRIKRKIDLYRQRFFTQDDWDNLKSLAYLENGLVRDLQNSVLSLQTLCALQLESSNVIETMGNLLFSTTVPSSNPVKLVNSIRQFVYQMDVTRGYFCEFGDDLNHLKALERGHDDIAKRIFGFGKNNFCFDLCANYLSVMKKLPDYVLTHLDIDLSENITLTKFLGRYPDFRRTTLLRMLKNSIILCNIANYNKIVRTITPIISQDEFSSTVMNGISDLFRNAHIFDCMRELKTFIALINNEIIYEKVLTNIHVVGYNYLALRAMIVKSRDRPNQKAELEQMWNDHFHQDEIDGLLVMDNILNIHDVCVSSFGQFSFSDACYFIFPNGESTNVFERRQVLPYLQRLDVLAQRDKRPLDFKKLLTTACHHRYEDVCQWVLKTMLEREINFDACILLNEYLNEKYQDTFDIPWFIALLHPYQKITKFDSVYNFVAKIFKNEDVFIHDEITSTTIIQSLIWLEDKLDYINLFEQLATTQPYRNYEIVKSERPYCAARNLEVLKWIVTQVESHQRPIFYIAVARSPIFANSVISTWATNSVEC